MALPRRFTLSTPDCVPSRAPTESPRASLALAALCLAMDAISWRLDETSSMALACSEAPWASAWLPELI